MAQNEKNMSRYFGTNGVRGRFDELTPELAMRISQAVGAYFKKGRMIVARDARLTGEVLRNAVCAGLMGVGCDVVDLGVVPAPTAEFMVKKLKADGCIIITASHNPPEWNALKVVDGKGISISRERGGEIEKLMGCARPADWKTVGRLAPCGNAADEHIAAIAKLVDSARIKKRSPKLVLDCGNGTAALVAPKLLSSLGARIIPLNDMVDGRFPGRPSEPAERNVQELMARVKSEKADAGIAWDGDADRVIFVDENGAYVIGDRVFALCALWKLSEKKGDIVTTVATSRAAEDVAKRYGCRTVYTKIGAPYLSEELAKGKAVMGGEEVGGVIWPELSLAKDGMLTAAKMVEKLCEKPLSAWLAEVPEYHNVKRTIEANGDAKKLIVGKMLAHANKNRLDHIEIDGVRVNLPEGWVIVRASGTEDYVRIFAEAKTRDKAERIMEEYSRILGA